MELRELWDRVETLPQNAIIPNEVRNKRAPSTAEKKVLPNWGKISASRVSNNCRPQTTYFSTQKLSLSQAESIYSPQRLVETTHPRTQGTPTITQLRPRPLLEMKTINTTTDIQDTPPPLFSFELPTIPNKPPPFPGDNPTNSESE